MQDSYIRRIIYERTDPEKNRTRIDVFSEKQYSMETKVMEIQYKLFKGKPVYFVTLPNPVILKASGFTLHNGFHSDCPMCSLGFRSVWFTENPVIAKRLLEYCEPETRRLILSETRVGAFSGIIPCPTGKAYLPFQEDGIRFSLRKGNVLIGDEMGLGKTVQALGVINSIQIQHGVLIVCPATLKLNWRNEVKNWLVRKFSVEVVDKNQLINPESQVVIVNYEMLKGRVLESVMSRRWDVLIVDEAHYLKSRTSKRTKVLLGDVTKNKTSVRTEGVIKRCSRILMLTGTPIMNHPFEIFPLVNAICPEEFGSFWQFVRRYCDPVHSRFGWDFKGAANLDELNRKLRLFCMIRRLKSEVLKELPEKRTQVILFPDTSKLKDRELALIRKHEIPYDTEEDISQAWEQIRRKKTAFNEMSTIRRETGIAKVKLSVEHIKTVLDEEQKVVVFAHHHEVIRLLQSELVEFNPVVLTGEQSQVERDHAVNTFQNDPTCRVFLGSIRAAGTGITLTASSVVIFVEIDWTPGWIDQAADREHRIGQLRQVLVQFIVIDGTMDARILSLITTKRSVINAALNREVKLDDRTGDEEVL